MEKVPRRFHLCNYCNKKIRTIKCDWPARHLHKKCYKFIIGQLEFISKTYPPSLQPEYKEYLENVLYNR